MRALLPALAAFTSCFWGAAGADAAPLCEKYPPLAARALKPRIEVLRLIEREAADRLKGLDTRPFSYLVAQASSAASLIGQARALEEEDALERCPEPVVHVRRVCATAALALAGMLEAEGSGAGRGNLRAEYAQAMAICEGLVGLAPLPTAWRSAD